MTSESRISNEFVAILQEAWWEASAKDVQCANLESRCLTGQGGQCTTICNA